MITHTIKDIHYIFSELIVQSQGYLPQEQISNLSIMLDRKNYLGIVNCFEHNVKKQHFDNILELLYDKLFDDEEGITDLLH